MGKTSLFQIYDAEKCWICGGREGLSREHKFKASDIRRQFGKQLLYVATEEENGLRSRPAQGPKSDALKFTSRICAHCNSTRTQQADRAYSDFVCTIERKSDPEKMVSCALTYLDGLVGSARHLDISRYFAKLLGCSLADIGAPIPLRLSGFVKGETDSFCIALAVQQDRKYARLAAQFDEFGPHSSRGDFRVVFQEESLLPLRYESAYTVGAVQFAYSLKFTEAEVTDLRDNYGQFINTWVEQLQPNKPLGD